MIKYKHTNKNMNGKGLKGTIVHLIALKLGLEKTAMTMSE